MSNESINSTPPHPLERPIILQRNKAGAYTPLGRRWSMLANQLRHSAPPVFIDQTRREIEQIQRDGGRYVHENHGAGR
jgi:hypothetical protein